MLERRHPAISLSFAGAAATRSRADDRRAAVAGVRSLAACAQALGRECSRLTGGGAMRRRRLKHGDFRDDKIIQYPYVLLSCARTK